MFNAKLDLTEKLEISSLRVYLLIHLVKVVARITKYSFNVFVRVVFVSVADLKG